MQKHGRDLLPTEESSRNPRLRFHSVAITDEQDRKDHFIIGVHTEKILEAGFTGLNTNSGDLRVVRGKGSNAFMNKWAEHIYIILHTDQILEIRDSGCQVFD